MMKTLSVRLAFLFLLVFGTAGRADTIGGSFLRVGRPSTNVVQLEIALRRFVPKGKTGPSVWLSGVAHLGEAAYYSKLQTHLDAQDLVLFEGVGATNGVMAEGAGGDAADTGTHTLQADLAKSLGLVFQLSALNYDRPHFQNSDMSVERIQSALTAPAAVPGGPADADPVVPGDAVGTDRVSEEDPIDAALGLADGEDADQVFDQLMEMMNGSGSVMPLVDNVLAALSANPGMQSLTKVVLIEMMGGLEGDAFGQLGNIDPRLGRLFEVLIEERNQTVLRDLHSALNRPDPPGSVSIFYGAGHMHHFQEMLGERFGLVPVEETWLPAFSVDLDKAGLSPIDLQMVRSVVAIQKALFSPRSGGRGAAVDERDEGLIAD